MEEKIIICPKCKGTGKIKESELTDYHHREWDEWDEPCCFCDGTGRVVEQLQYRCLTKKELELRKREGSPAGTEDASNSAEQANHEICPHYFESTDGVHCIVVGQCKCKGKLS